jgi:erythromycin esterase-like protein
MSRSSPFPLVPSIPLDSLRRTLGVAATTILVAACDPVEAPAPATGEAAEAVRQTAHPVTGEAADYDPLLAMIGDARVVMLGEQTHGTHEFYRERARITQRLIQEKGFSAVAIEGDWPETYRVNRFVRARGSDETAEQALSGYERFPVWMWRNADVLELVQWLRAHNDAQSDAADVGIYGLDVYSLGTSIDAVIQYLSQVEPAAAEQARGFYACFEPYDGDPQRYGQAAARNPGGASCEAHAAQVLRDMQQRAARRPADPVAAEELFSALRNAHAVVNAEEYFRTLYQGSPSTWNLRDQRMAENLEALEAHLAAATGRPAKVVVWAHNTHAGDARHTETAAQGELNIGQLVRDRHGANARLVGFFTYTGTVFAAPGWDRPGRVYDLRPALAGSFGDVFHASGVGDFLLPLAGESAVAAALAAPRLERAVGVVYAPQSERQSHYFTARLSRQFDAAVFFDVTSAVQPLPR